MLAIAITGSIGAGKTAAAKIVEKLRRPVLFTDQVAKELMQNDENLKKSLVAEFGGKTYAVDGSLDSAYLAEIVFGDEKRLETLNSITHPYVIDEMIKWTEHCERSGERLAFIESALIFETGLDDGFDFVVSIFAPEELCLKRTVERGMSEKQARRRIASQFSPERKKQLADFVVENTGNLDELEKTVSSLVEMLADIEKSMPDGADLAKLKQ